MSFEFTDISQGGDAQGITFANEIIQSYNEHNEVLGGPGFWPHIDLLVGGEDAQERTIWRCIQDFLEYNCDQFVDHVNGPFVEGESGTTLLYFTTASWRAAAGLNALGFQTSTDGVNMQYSEGPNIMAGHVRGRWNFTDLQKGLSALKYTYKAATLNSKAYRYAYSTWPIVGWWQDGWPECVAAWGSAEWQDGVGIDNPEARVEYAYYESFTGKYKMVYATRERTKYQIDFDADLPRRYIDAYIQGFKVDTESYAYFDFDDNGCTFPPVIYKLLQSDIDAGEGTQYLTDWFGNIDTCPASIFVPGMVAEFNYKWPSFIGSLLFLARWDFTYQND